MRPFVACLFFLSFAAIPAAAQASEGGTVLTVTPALAVLGREIAPAGIIVEYPGPPDENASDWEPDTATLRRYQRADLVLLVGAGYGNWVATTALPRARLIDTSAAFADRFIQQSSETPGHQHGPSGSASHHSTYANHFWLDLSLARSEANQIAQAFTRLWPEHEAQISANLNELTGQLDRLQAELGQEFETLGDATLFASHPVYQYLDRTHGLGLHNFHWEPDQHPGPDEWAALDSKLSPDRRNVMIWEADPLPETRAELERRGVGIVIISPSQAEHRTGPLRARLGFPERIDFSN